jgi:predicted transcriptional regulator
MKSISIRVEDTLYVKIDNIAKMQDRDRSYIINKAIKEYIEHEEYILEQIHEAIKDIEEGRVHIFEDVKKEMDEYIANKR